MEEEARVEMSLENRFKEALRKAKEVREYIKERNDTRELDVAEWLAYDMRYVEEYVKQLEEKNKHLSSVSDYETISMQCNHLEELLDITEDRVKELEKENEEWQRAYQEEKDKQFELLRENKQLEEDNEQLEAIKNEAIRRYNFETIPKSKVKEKIEELEKDLERDRICIDFVIEHTKDIELKAKIEALQELLEREGK